MLRWRRVWAAGAATVISVAVLAGPAAAAPALEARAVAAPAAKSDPAGRQAAETVAQMSTVEQATSIVMGHIGGTDAAALRAYMQSGLGGFILMGGNIPGSEAELRALTEALTVDPALPPLIAVDQEGGLVSRLHGDDFPASTSLKDGSDADVAAAFAARASLVARAGISVNFGTVADVTADPQSFIAGRALGTDPAGAGEHVAAATAAQEPFLASTLKHFPGHGAAPGDSHSSIPSTEMTLDDWRATDAVPFIDGIDAGASLVMLGHLSYTAVDPLPATLSPVWHGVLRDDLDFDGVTVTDDLGMLLSSGIPEYSDPVRNAVLSVAAGNDLVLMIAGSTAATAGQMATGIAAAVDDGTLSADRLAEAATRVLALRLERSTATSDWTVCAECQPAG
jgi:beta-N-acetylhexosaminidase